MFRMISQASHVWPDHADWRSGTRLASSLVRLREIGSVAASSRHLARQMAMQVDYQQSGLIVELGPGLGAITREVYKRVANRKQLLLIEVGGAFIPELKRQFHGVTVVHDSAEWLLKHVRGRRVAAVVSSLPLRSLPNKVVHRIGVALSQVMDAQTRYIQFTYDLRPTESAYFTHMALEKQYSRIVWRNLPPARVDTFCLATEPPTDHPEKTLLQTSAGS
ncbi:MAG: hypothetical protein HQL99_07470 [Magnetococcales bacterium]|nr:hypothetical protein [Magnetococcales bacterium]